MLYSHALPLPWTQTMALGELGSQMFRFLRIRAQRGMVEDKPQPRHYYYEARFNAETSRRYLKRGVSVIEHMIVCSTCPS